LSVHSPAIGATVNVPISVSVVTADGMVLDAGTYKYTTQ
jgi:hypothetical protein